MFTSWAILERLPPDEGTLSRAPTGETSTASIGQRLDLRENKVGQKDMTSCGYLETDCLILLGAVSEPLDRQRKRRKHAVPGLFNGICLDLIYLDIVDQICNDWSLRIEISIVDYVSSKKKRRHFYRRSTTPRSPPWRLSHTLWRVLCQERSTGEWDPVGPTLLNTDSLGTKIAFWNSTPEYG